MTGGEANPADGLRQTGVPRGQGDCSPSHRFYDFHGNRERLRGRPGTGGKEDPTAPTASPAAPQPRRVPAGRPK